MDKQTGWDVKIKAMPQYDLPGSVTPILVYVLAYERIVQVEIEFIDKLTDEDLKDYTPFDFATADGKNYFQNRCK